MAAGKQARHTLGAHTRRHKCYVPARAVTAFARETGDLHALSRTDLKLLALAYSLEVAAHGDAHLRKHPVQVRIAPFGSSVSPQQPGAFLADMSFAARRHAGHVETQAQDRWPTAARLGQRAEPKGLGSN